MPGRCTLTTRPALLQFRSTPSSKDVSFTIKYLPYQLYPELGKEGVDKYEYKRTKWDNSDERMEKFVTLMSTYGKGAGIDFDFHGAVANTLNAHRFISHYQEELGPKVADEIVNSLYAQYFTQRAHPSAPETLLKAASDAGIDHAKAKAFVDDEHDGLVETKMSIQEQASNGIDSVPYVIIEGKRRDFTLVGAKETVDSMGQKKVKCDHRGIMTPDRVSKGRLLGTNLLILGLLFLDQSSRVEGLTVKPDSKRHDGFPSESSLVQRNRQPSELAVFKRIFRDTGGLDAGWVGHFIRSNPIYPYPVGLQILGKFYALIVDTANGAWSTLPTSNTRAIHYGTINLWFWSDDPLVQITWEFVRDFAARMHMETTRGFMALYDAAVVHVATGMMVHIRLQITGK
ncbi:MAG: hypothetical protein Q9194_004915 [Teloschistes cf. exilis]